MNSKGLEEEEEEDLGTDVLSLREQIEVAEHADRLLSYRTLVDNHKAELLEWQQKRETIEEELQELRGALIPKMEKEKQDLLRKTSTLNRRRHVRKIAFWAFCAVLSYSWPLFLALVEDDPLNAEWWRAALTHALWWALGWTLVERGAMTLQTPLFIALCLLAEQMTLSMLLSTVLWFDAGEELLSF